tara:strand:- start:221 stop:427 length:207 start_codon:yes stop_codon:yes gene_type:complete
MSELTKECMKILKEVDPNMSDRMRSHWKLQIKQEDGLIFKLLMEISDKNDIIEERDLQIRCLTRGGKK